MNRQNVCSMPKESWTERTLCELRSTVPLPSHVDVKGVRRMRSTALRLSASRASSCASCSCQHCNLPLVISSRKNRFVYLYASRRFHLYLQVSYPPTFPVTLSVSPSCTATSASRVASSKHRYHIAMALAALLLLATAAMSQTTNSSADTSSESIDNRLCNSSISAANASGLITYDPTDPYRSGDAPAHSWAITVSGGNGQAIQRDFWYDTAGQNYADDVGLDMDVCAFPNFYLPLNADRLGHNDPGNCSTIFSQRCIDAVTSMASQSALKWVTYSSPPPYENLTAGVLPSICQYIANDLKETIQKECGAQMLSDNGVLANFGNSLGE
jgi:hypothetical protein